MKAISKFAIPAAALAFAAFGVQAQTIETHYPAAVADGSAVVTAPASVAVASQGSPYLVQSNFEGPKADPAQIVASTKTRDGVRAEAKVNVRWTPADMRGSQANRS